MITGAQALIQCLEAQGISVIFGYPGAANGAIYDQLTQSSIRHVLVRQEQHAGHSANGYARISGKPSVCMATSGPGATNLITALATAYMDSIPIIAITGQVHRSLLGKDGFQEADIMGSTEPFTKHSYMVMDAADIPRIVNEAFYIAGTGRPGPVLIDIPLDVQDQTIDHVNISEPIAIKGYKPTQKGHPMQIKRAIQAIKEAKKPLVCIGGGVFAAKAEQVTRQFSEQFHIPVVATMMGISIFPTNHPNYFGMLGSHGKPYANKAIHEADTLILIGARVGNRAMSAPKHTTKDTTVIHIDVDPAEIGKNMKTEIPIVGDARLVLEQFLEYSHDQQYEEWKNQLIEWKAAYIFDFQERETTVNPKAFVRLLSDAMDDDAIYCADVGQNQIWSSNNIEIRNGRFLTSGGMGTMGYSIPAAIGAKMADPDKQVIAVCGDGSFQMNLTELATAVENNVPIKIVVMKNQYLGMVRELQTNNFNDNLSGVQLGTVPDICALAKAYGIQAERVERLNEAPAAIDRMFKSRGIYLIECTVDMREKSL
jgi:acetolactate synthase-1/2/3 large subunit